MDDESVEKSKYIGTITLAIKEFTPHTRIERWCDIREDLESHASDQMRGSLHIIVTYFLYTREQIAAKRGDGSNETVKKLYEEQRIMSEQTKKEHNTAGDA